MHDRSECFFLKGKFRTLMTVCALSVRWGEQLRPEVPLPRHPGVPLQRGLRGDEVAPGEGPRRGGRFLLRPMRLQVQLQGPAEQAPKNSLIYQDQVSSLAVVCIPGLCFSFFCRSYACLYCPFVCSRHPEWLAHVSATHGNKASGEFRCHICDWRRATGDSRALKTHLMKEHGVTVRRVE